MQTLMYLHKITNVSVFNMALGLNDFDANNPLLGPLERGDGLKISTFWAQMALSSLGSI
jgi:hypothetical protein